MENFDLIILGGGPAGYMAAERAGAAGLKVMLIEKNKLGGVCLNEGCIPSKTLLKSAKIYKEAIYSARYGITVDQSAVTYSQETVINRKNKVVKVLVAGIKSALKEAAVEVMSGEGKIMGKSKEGFSVKINGNAEIFLAKYILIATGSKPILPHIDGLYEGLESGFVLTNKDILDLREIPEILVVVGGGVIGLEMAAYYNAVGTKVIVVEMLDKIAGPTDRDVSDILMEKYKSMGVTFYLKTKAVGFSYGVVKIEKDDVITEIEASKVLISIGRSPVIDDLGLSTIGIEIDHGAIVTDEKMRTNVPGVYAAGDVNGRWMLAHVAYREAEVAVNNILGKDDEMKYNAIPSAIYTKPEVGSVGETEETAALAGIEFEVVNIPMRFSGRYVAEVEGGIGICKVLIDKKTRKMIGCHLVGTYASEIITTASAIIENGSTVSEIKKIIFPHPSVSEIIREAIFKFED
jgi:dihydrolipoamide dehydrogenase